MENFPKDELAMLRLKTVVENFCSKCENELTPTSREFCDILGAISTVIDVYPLQSAKRKEFAQLRAEVSTVYKSSLTVFPDYAQIDGLKELSNTLANLF